jgi:hydrophobe/amphiphile efflux-1 (HAE1) family protein
LTDACIRRPVMAWMLMGAVLILGGLAASRIGISQFPDVDIPIVSVDVSWEGAAPAVIEKDVVEVLEEALAQVEGVKALRSTASQGSASLTLEFDLGRNIDLALQDAQAKVSQAQRQLPTDIDPPVIRKRNPEDFPIMWLGLNGPFPAQVLSDYAYYRVKDRLQQVPGIGEIMMGGALERNVRVWLDAQKLDAQGLTVAEVNAALRRQHVELPAGQLISGGRETNVRVMGEAMDLNTLRALTVAERNGTPVTLEQVALVEDGFEDVRRLTRVDGLTAQGLGVKKQRGANAVAVAQEVYKAVAELRANLPAGMDLGVNFDSTVYISDSVHEMQFEIMLSVILTALMCWFFLGSWSSTINVVLAIPMSLLGTVAVLYFLGMTLNTFTLLGLGLAVGLVVDDAIMVLENITRHRQMGEDRIRAAKYGTREIAFAALAASVAVVAIFSPVLFMDGMVGRFFLQFGIALCVAVMLSYVEAVTLAPARCAQFLSVEERRGPVGRLAEASFKWMERTYARVLAPSLRHPWLVLIGAGVAVSLSLGLFALLPREMVPSQDQSRLQVRLQTAVGSSIQETDALIKRAEAIIHAMPEVERSFVMVGGFGGSNGVNTGGAFLTLVPKKDRTLTQAEIQDKLRRELRVIPGLRVMIQDPSNQTFTAQRGFPVEVSVRGPDWDTLLEASRSMMVKLNQSGLVVDLDSDTDLGMPELRVIPDRARCADLGVSMEDVATSLNALVGGVLVGKYSTGDRRMDIRLRLLAGQRTSSEDLQRLRVRTRSGDLVPISSLVTIEEKPALQDIRRANRQRAIGLTANVAAGHSQQEALDLVLKLGSELPAGYRVVLVGSSASYQESNTGLLFALILGVIAAYMVLAAQFNSFLHPITVLSILPLTLTGAGIALWLGGQSLNLFSIIGLLLLMGIAKKNSIILVDYANQVRERGETSDPAEAMRRAGPVRLRPILMTSCATILAAVPLALALGPGGEIRAPMAIAVIGGIAVSTVLSLVVVPAFYVIADRLSTRLRRAPKVTAPSPMAEEVHR